MRNSNDDLLSYYSHHLAEIDTATNPHLLFLLDYLQTYGPMTMRELTSDIGFGERSTEQIITTLLDHGMVEERGAGRWISIARRGQRLLKELLGKRQDPAIRGLRNLLGIGGNVLHLPKPLRSDFVVGLTLAELFLLLIFVVWYQHTALLRNQHNQEQQLSQLHTKVALLDDKLDAWRQVTGSETAGAFAARANEWCRELGRGYAKCEQDNVLVDASVVKGRISMRFLTRSASLWKWLADSGRSEPPLHVEITDPSAIHTLLEEVAGYYRYARIRGSKCRFDYRMTYLSKEDYYDGRELFERYFYPEAVTRLK